MESTKDEKTAVRIFRRRYPLKLSVAQQIIAQVKTNGSYTTSDESFTVSYTNGRYVFA